MNKERLIIGVLGGMGPYATVDLYKRLVDAFPTEKDWEKPRILIDSYSTIPSRVRALLYGEKTEELLECMTSSLRGLINAGANKIIIACNTAHVFLPDIIKRVPESEELILNIIDLCAEECKMEGIQAVHLLASEGTIQSGIYENVLSKYNITVNLPETDELKTIRELIEDVKQNRISDMSLMKFSGLIKEKKCPVILGCTELPVLYGKCTGMDILHCNDIIDPLQSVINKLVAL